MDTPVVVGPVQRPRDFLSTVLAMSGLCFVLIMVALDQTVIGTALPTAVAELHGFELYAWVGTAYLLTSVVAVPVFGKLGDEHGRKPFVIAAIVLFTLASMLCGAAQTMWQLVLARGVQGIGGGMLVATAFACIPDLFPQPAERLRWQIMFSTSFGLANAFGPSLGGYLAQYWGWRWVFYVNLPVGVLSLYCVWRYLPLIRHREGPPSRLDWFGALLAALTLGSLQLLMEWLPHRSKPGVVLAWLGALCIGAALLLVWWERRCDNPVLPLDMLTHRSLAPMFALSATMGLSMFAVMYYAPLMLQGGFGLAPNQAGLLVTPMAVFITVGSIANGRIVTRLDHPNRMMYVGVALFWLAAVGLARTTAATAHVWVVSAMMLAGLGVGVLLPNLTLFTQACAPRAQLGVATAMIQSTRMVGGMLGTALVGTMVSSAYTHGVEGMLRGDGSRWLPWLGDPQVLVDAAQALRFKQAAARAGSDAAPLIEQARHILVDGIHRGQWLVVFLMMGACWLAWLVPPMKLRGQATEVVQRTDEQHAQAGGGEHA